MTEQRCVGLWRDLDQGVQAQQKGQGACPLPLTKALQLHPLHAPKTAVTEPGMEEPEPAQAMVTAARADTRCHLLLSRHAPPAREKLQKEGFS